MFSFVSSIVSTAVSSAKSAWASAKRAAAKAVQWMATEAESVVRGVKKIWEHVSPHVTKVQTALKVFAKAAPSPWLKTAALALDRALTALVAFENSPVAKKFDAAIKWLIQLAKRLNETNAKAVLSDAELNEAERHQEVLRQTADGLSVRDQHAIEVASTLNDYVIANTKLASAIGANDVKDSQRYLRLRATQKLILEARAALERAQTMAEVSSDDRFLLRVAGDLVKAEPRLAADDAARLDGVLMERHGKPLVTFVFEEMIVAWHQRLLDLETRWKNTRDQHSNDVVALRRLETAKKFAHDGNLGASEQASLDRLHESVAASERELEQRRLQELEMRTYVDAAEGFLQTLEHTPEQLEKSGRGYLVDDGRKTGELIMACAQNGSTWSSLSEEDQGLLIDFANIFRADCQKRVQRLIEVVV